MNRIYFTSMLLVIFFILPINAYSSNRLLYENFDDKALDPRLTVFGNNWAILSPPQYNLTSAGRGGSGYCFSSGTISTAYISWMGNSTFNPNHAMPNPWPSDEMYVSFWMRYPTGSTGCDNLKFFYPHWNSTESYVHYSAITGESSCYYSAFGHGSALEVGGGAFLSGASDGNWHHYEFWIKFSTTEHKFWFDGTLKISRNYADGAWNLNGGTVYYISAPSIDAETSDQGKYSRQIDDWEVRDGMPTGGATTTTTAAGSTTTTVSAINPDIAWSAVEQAGSSIWTDSTASWSSVRMLIKGDSIASPAEFVNLSFEGRNTGNYRVRKISIAERDLNGGKGDIIDSTWQKVTLGINESAWGTDVFTIGQGTTMVSKGVGINFQPGHDYYVTFFLESPANYLMAPADCEELYFTSGDYTEVLDWDGKGYSTQSSRIHAVSVAPIPPGPPTGFRIIQ